MCIKHCRVSLAFQPPTPCSSLVRGRLGGGVLLIGGPDVDCMIDCMIDITLKDLIANNTRMSRGGEGGGEGTRQERLGFFFSNWTTKSLVRRLKDNIGVFHPFHTIAHIPRRIGGEAWPSSFMEIQGPSG